MNTEQSSKYIFPHIKQSKLNCESFSFHTSQYTELRQNVKKSLRFSDVFRDSDKGTSVKRFIFHFASEKWSSQSEALS